MDKSKVTERVIALSLLAVLMCGVSLGQQGWAQLQILKSGGSPSGINAVFYDGDVIWVVGAKGLIATSRDDGQTFQEINHGVSEGLNDISVRKDRLCIVGDAGTILKSTDRGKSFVKILRPTRPSGPSGGQLDLYSVVYIDDDHAVIVGDHGLILASSDGGASWREQSSGTDAQLFHLSFRGEKGWAIGTGGTILHTDNGGRNWYPQRSAVKED